MSGDPAASISLIREELQQFLASPEISVFPGGAGIIADQAPLVLDTIVKSRAIPEYLENLLSRSGDAEPLLGRWILAQSALRSLGRIAELPVTDEVRQLILRDYRLIAAVSPGRDALFLLRGREFRELAEIVLLKRFVAGQLHWNISGVPRSWPFKMKWRDALRTVDAVRRMGGWAPCFEAHIPTRGSSFLMEREYKQCYLRMAQSMELQLAIRGIIGSSWIHSEETMRISPHLQWLNNLFLENGGLLVHMGEAPVDSGFLVGSRQRKQLYDSGEYRPRNAMFLWPRAAFLNWARQLSSRRS